MHRLNLPFQAKGEVLWEVPEFADVPSHLLQQILHLGLEIILNTESEKTRGPEDHPDYLSVTKPQGLDVLELGK